MSFTQFLINLSVTFLTVALPVSISIYFAIRLAIAHGEVSFRRRNKTISSEERNRIGDKWEDRTNV